MGRKPTLLFVLIMIILATLDLVPIYASIAIAAPLIVTGRLYSGCLLKCSVSPRLMKRTLLKPLLNRVSPDSSIVGEMTLSLPL